jgi:hypothetical protein
MTPTFPVRYVWGMAGNTIGATRYQQYIFTGTYMLLPAPVTAVIHSFHLQQLYDATPARPGEM